MDTSKVIYKGGLRTEATHLRSGSVIVTDAPVDNHGKGEAFSPTDLAATSVASCLMTVMGIYAQNHDIDMTGSEATVLKIMNIEGPRRITGIKITVIIRSEKPINENQKKALEHTAKTCPVALSLHPDLKQELTINFER